MTTVFLPPNPTLGQQYVATNGATYTWLGNRWSSVVAIEQNTAIPYYEGGDSLTWAGITNNVTDSTLDGGTSQ